MNAQAGERYRCSDANCGCEIEITIPSAAQDDAEDEVIGSANDRSIVGSLSSSDVASHPEARGISTPGDHGFQEPGEGLYASGGNPRGTRFKSGSSNASGPTDSSIEEPGFSCCCGQPMRKSSSHGRSSSREMA